MGLLYMNWDIWYFILVLPAMILSMIASAGVKRTFNKYSALPSIRKYTGADTVKKILDFNGIRDVQIQPISGQLTDHFDPTKKIISLSEPTYGSYSVAAISVAAHETGHAIQHQQSYLPNKIRGVLVPVANIGSMAGPYLAIFGIILGFPLIINIGIALFGVAVLFYLVTLPVEFNASRRAIIMLEKTNILYAEELVAAKKVLTAAALTYVASLAVSITSFARLILLSRGRRK